MLIAGLALRCSQQGSRDLLQRIGAQAYALGCPVVPEV